MPGFFNPNKYEQRFSIMSSTYGIETDTWPVIPFILKEARLPLYLTMLVPIKASTRASRARAFKQLVRVFKG